MTEACLFLKAGREKSVRQMHPWIFSGAVEKVTGEPAMGETVEVYDRQGKWLARAGYSPHSQILARIWTWDPNQPIDTDFFRRKLEQAERLRRPLRDYTDGYRLIHAENDGLPGFIADRYGVFLVIQFLSASAERWRSTLEELLFRWEGIQGVYERSNVEVRGKEGLPASVGLISGIEPPEKLTIREGGWKFLVDIRRGHKTGFYLDQRESRQTLLSLVSHYAKGGHILNVFSYTGAFAVAAYTAGAGCVWNIDSSPSLLSLAREQLSMNGMPHDDDSFITGNAFEVLRSFRDEDKQFDIVILDPPKFVTARKDLRKGLRAYKDINWLAMRIIRPEGYLLTFSCSGHVSEDLFQKTIFSAALDAGRSVQLMSRLGQPIDHPVQVTFPEGQYLRGFLCRVI